MREYGALVGKILEFLNYGFLLGFTKNPKERRRLLEDCDRAWYEIDRKVLGQALKRLKLQGVIKEVEQNGSSKISITNLGQKRFLEHRLRNLKIEPKKKWGRKWQIVLFDIPEAQRKTRDALRGKLKELGFLEFQKSVFIFPYPCKNEINFIINFFNIADRVYYLEAPIVPDGDFRRHFHV